jgi:signal transduction histidine kinase
VSKGTPRVPNTAPVTTAHRGSPIEVSTMRTLNKFAVDLIQIPSIEDLFWYVAQNVVGKLNFVDCVIYQADDDQTSLRQVAAWGGKNPFGRNILNPLIIPFGRGITGQVAQTRKPIIVDDLRTDQNYIPDTEPARSEICVPLIFRGRVVGVIDSEHPQPNAFGAVELEILDTVAAMTGAKLELLAEAQRSAQRYRDLVASHERLSQEIGVRKALEARLHDARRMESIGKLTGRFAHEFNNLLTVVLGNLEIVLEAPETAEVSQSLADAWRAAERGALLVQDMLSFAQRTRLNPVETDLNAIIHAFVQALPLLNGVVVDLALDEELGLILVDTKALEQILSHLIDNAMTAVGDQGTVTIRTENVQKAMAGEVQGEMPGEMELPPGRYVRVSVEDTGAGIPQERLSQIFDPFFTTKAVGKGTGLGLSIVRGLTQQSGGSVSVVSELEKGSTFHILFPALG